MLVKEIKTEEGRLVLQLTKYFFFRKKVKKKRKRISNLGNKNANLQALKVCASEEFFDNVCNLRGTLHTRQYRIMIHF